MINQNYALVDTDYIPERDTEADFSEWFEDAASEAEWADNVSNAYSIPDESSHSRMGLLDELYDKNQALERARRHADQKVQNVLLENQKLTIQLANEKHRAAKFQKKLEYIQSHHEIFNHLKQAYLNMKYNEAAGRNMIEIKEVGCQTWNLTELCPACLGTSSHMRSDSSSEQIVAYSSASTNMITVKREDLDKLQATVSALKDMIDAREKTHSYTSEREQKYKADIEELKTRIGYLNEYISNKFADKDGKLPDLTEPGEENVTKENGIMQTIIIKLEKQRREHESLHSPSKKSALTAKEKLLIQQLSRRFVRKLEKKRSCSCDHKVDVATATTSHARSPRIPLNIETIPLDYRSKGDSEKITMTSSPRRNRPRTRGSSERPEKPLTPKLRVVAKNNFHFVEGSSA